MLINLRTLHRPTTVDEAADLLEKPGVRPLYGAALVRENPKDAEEAVDLGKLGLDRIEVRDGVLIIGSTATLESVRLFCLEQESIAAQALAEAIAIEFPNTLRNAMTPGDVITEARGSSALLTFFAAMADRTDIERRGKLILARRLRLDTPVDSAGFGFEKVARTPADAPIVGAWAWAERNADARVAVCGLHPKPALYTFGEVSELDDYLGSAEYRTEMAKVVARRAIDKATAMSGLL